jgi:hypothetical protein
VAFLLLACVMSIVNATGEDDAFGMADIAIVNTMGIVVIGTTALLFVINDRREDSRMDFRSRRISSCTNCLSKRRLQSVVSDDEAIAAIAGFDAAEFPQPIAWLRTTRLWRRAHQKTRLGQAGWEEDELDGQNLWERSEAIRINDERGIKFLSTAVSQESIDIGVVGEVLAAKNHFMEPIERSRAVDAILHQAIASTIPELDPTPEPEP